VKSMKLSRSLRSIAYGVATYLAVAVSGIFIGKAVYYAIPRPNVAFGPLAAALAGGLSEMLVMHVAAPAACGFVTARTAASKPYVQLLYVAIVNLVILAFVLVTPLPLFKFPRIKFMHYGVFFLFDLVIALLGAWYGSQRATQLADDALIQSLRDAS
jgi:hypothetical protein